MQSIDMTDINAMIARFDKVIAGNEERRRRLHEHIGTALKNTLDSKIQLTINNNAGKVKGWQEKRIGSGGGYAAISPISGATGKNSPGAITNYLENGHRIRPPGTGKRYRPRIKMSYVNGRHFYAATRNCIESQVMPPVREFAEQLARDLGG